MVHLPQRRPTHPPNQLRHALRADHPHPPSHSIRQPPPHPPDPHPPLPDKIPPRHHRLRPADSDVPLPSPNDGNNLAASRAHPIQHPILHQRHLLRRRIHVLHGGGIHPVLP